VKKSHSITDNRIYTPRATLCAIGLKIRSWKLFETVAEHVHIRQKTIRHMVMLLGTLAHNVVV
jgi:hypothetical protein